MYSRFPVQYAELLCLLLPMHTVLHYTRATSVNPSSWLDSLLTAVQLSMLRVPVYKALAVARCALPRAAPTSEAESACGLWLRRAQCMSISKMQNGPIVLVSPGTLPAELVHIDLIGI